MKYVALLRGINVGGNNKVSMADLKLVFEETGMGNVSTYINSGNVIFESEEKDRHRLIASLERAIEKRFGFAVKVLVRSREDMLRIAAKLPDSWVNDTTMKCDAMFLWEEADTPDILKQIVIKPEIDQVIYEPGVLLWAVDRGLVTRSGLMRIAGMPLYKQMTIRNCNTLRKLAALMS